MLWSPSNTCSPLSLFTCTEIYSLLFSITCSQTSIPKPSHSFFTVTHTHCKIHVHVYTCSVAYFLHQRWLLIFSMVYLLAGLGFRIFFSNAIVCTVGEIHVNITTYMYVYLCSLYAIQILGISRNYAIGSSNSMWGEHIFTRPCENMLTSCAVNLAL